MESGADMRRTVARKESFGGIIGTRNGYGFHVVNAVGFDIIRHCSNRTQNRSHLDDKKAAEVANFLDNLKGLGYLNSDGSYSGELIDNKNNVPFLSAPIRVWLEVTSRCNLRCSQCFNNEHSEFKNDLSFDSLQAILDDLYKSGVLQITITGGEPLLRKDIWKILDYTCGLGFGVRFFTNGTLLTEENSQRLAKYPLSHVYASMDGIDGVNDLLRGAGTYKRIAKGIRELTRSAANVTLSVTLHRYSLRNIDKIFSFAQENNIQSLLIRPLLQYSGQGFFIERDEIMAMIVRLEEASQKYDVEYQLNKLPFFQHFKAKYLHDLRTDVHFSYFNNYNKFGCVGGNTVVGIKSNGVIMACGFVPIKYAIEGNNASEGSFLDLWNNATNITVLRDLESNDKCSACSLLSVCGGGCRANALMHNKDIRAVDPYCFLDESTKTYQQSARFRNQTGLKQDELPYISERTIVTKCGAGTLL